MLDRGIERRHRPDDQRVVARGGDSKWTAQKVPRTAGRNCPNLERTDRQLGHAAGRSAVPEPLEVLQKAHSDTLALERLDAVTGYDSNSLRYGSQQSRSSEPRGEDIRHVYAD